jgi:hypothetical protein
MRGTAAVVGAGYDSNVSDFEYIYSEAELRDFLQWIEIHWPERKRAHESQVTRRDQASQ